jgi:plasmid stabilization system protein ParE
MRKIKAVKLTANFQRNLDEIDRFLTNTEIPSAFAGLLEELLETVIPNLEQFPELGRPWFDQVTRSLEAEAANNALKSRLTKLTSDTSALRLYVLKHHVVLYAVIGQTIHLLAIRHQRQLSFDFAQHWDRGT